MITIDRVVYILCLITTYVPYHSLQIMFVTFFQIGSAICLNLKHVDEMDARSLSDKIVKSDRSAGYGSSSSFKKACFGLKQ